MEDEEEEREGQVIGSSSEERMAPSVLSDTTLGISRRERKRERERERSIKMTDQSLWVTGNAVYVCRCHSLLPRSGLTS